ncbi:MAG: hypothetical protein R2724_21575 [Bryobacterales bacterium]
MDVRRAGLPALTDPVLFLEAMWNHGAVMEEETAAGKIPGRISPSVSWPTCWPT